MLYYILKLTCPAQQGWTGQYLLPGDGTIFGELFVAKRKHQGLRQQTRHDSSSVQVDPIDLII